MAENENGREISELLDQLREKTVADASERQTKKEKKQKMTDDDVKNLLRKYFDDIDPPSGEAVKAEPQKDEAPNIYDIDTSDFVTGDETEETETVETVEEPETVEELEQKAAEAVEDDEPLSLEDIESFEEEKEDAFSLDIEDEPPFDLNEEPEAEEKTVPEVEEEAVPKVEEKAEEEIESETEEESEEDEFSLGLAQESGEDVSELEELEFIEDEPAVLDFEIEADRNEVEQDSEEDGVADDPIIYDYVHKTDDGAPIEAEEYHEPEDAPKEIKENITEESTEEVPVAESEKLYEYVTPAFELEPVPAKENAEAVEPVESEEEQAAGENEEEPVEQAEPEHEDINYDNVREADVDIMVALGFGDKIREKFGDERIMRATKNLRKNREMLDSERAFGYIGEEYTSPTQNEKIKQAFAKDKQLLSLRLSVTALFTLLLFLYENLQLFGITPGGIFDASLYPTAHTMLSLQLLVLCALPSWRSLYDGFLGAINQKPTARTLLTATLALIVLYDILIAVIAPRGGVLLFNFPMALGLLFGVLAEFIDLRRELGAFSLLSEGCELYVLTDIGDNREGKVMLSAEKTSFVSGYFERTGKREHTSELLLLTIVPLAALGIIVSVISAAMGQGISQSLGAFAGVIAFGSPLVQIVCTAWAELNLSLCLRSDGATVIGDSVKDEYTDAGVIVADDSFAFPEGSATVTEMQIFDNNEIYSTLYAISALFSVAGGPLEKTFVDAALELGAPESVILGEYGPDFVSARVDDRITVCAGSREALELRGIALPAESKTGNEDCGVMYVAVEEKPVARIVCKYSASKEADRVVKALAKDGVELRLRTLDPNINEALTERLFANGPKVTVSKERTHKTAEGSIDAAIVSAVGIGGLIRPLILRRRTKNMMGIRKMIRNVSMAVCAVFGAALSLLGMTVGLSPLAALCQILCFLPVLAVMLFVNNSNKI